MSAGMMLTATAVPAPVPGRRAEPPVRHCSRCEIIIYRSREEAAAVDRTFWAARRGHMTEASIRTGSSGVRFVPHINGAIGDLCASCAREVAGHYDVVTERQIGIYNQHYGGEFAANVSPEPAEPVGDPEEIDVKQKSAHSKRAEHSSEEIIELHREYVLERASLDDVGGSARVTGNTVRKWFQEMELPTRTRGGHWRPDDVPRICEIHNLQPDQVIGAAAAMARPAKAARASFNETAVRRDEPTQEPERAVGAPTPEPTPTAVAAPDPDGRPRAVAVVPAQETAVSPNGNGQAPSAGDLRQQLDVIQELLSLAEAQSVTLRGKISVELHAEVAF